MNKLNQIKLKENEEVKFIKGFDKDYVITSLGRVSSFKRGKPKELAGGRDRRGIKLVTLSCNGWHETFYPHSLVQDYFQ